MLQEGKMIQDVLMLQLLLQYDKMMQRSIWMVLLFPQDGRFVAGAGAMEVEMSQQIDAYSQQCPGLEQYSVKTFADSLKVFPKILAENSGAPGQVGKCNVYW